MSNPKDNDSEEQKEVSNDVAVKSKLDNLQIPTSSTQPKSNENDENVSATMGRNSSQQSFFGVSKTGWYQPQPPLGIGWFERTVHLGNVFNTPVDIHITLLYYILIEIIWSLLHFDEPLFWFLYVIIVLIFQLVSLYFHMIATMWCAKQVHATMHRVIIWPYGTMGYSSNYKKWGKLLITLYMGPLIHTLFIVIWVSIGSIIGQHNTQWAFEEPMSKNFFMNVCNGSWVVNSVILVFHLSIPIYSFKAGRLATSVLYRTRKVNLVADILIWPHTFMTIITLVFGINDLRPIGIFASLWCGYQTYLLWKAKRNKMTNRLPMFNNLESLLRSPKTLHKLGIEMNNQNNNENTNNSLINDNSNDIDNNDTNNNNNNKNENYEINSQKQPNISQTQSSNENGERKDNETNNKNKNQFVNELPSETDMDSGDEKPNESPKKDENNQIDGNVDRKNDANDDYVEVDINNDGND